MTPDRKTELLALIWPQQAGKGFTSDQGLKITVKVPGEPEPGTFIFKGAEISIEGVIHRGSVTTGGYEPRSQQLYDDCILQIVPEPMSCVLKLDGSTLPQVVVNCGNVTSLAYQDLKDNAGRFRCAGYFNQLDQVEQTNIFTRLLVDRLIRKCGELNELYEQCDQDWTETMHVMLMRAMGNVKNKRPFTELALRVKYKTICREKNDLHNVEALLLGTSGLLDLYEDDSYIRRLRTSYDYLRSKYGITPMLAGEWAVGETHPASHPVIRIAQLASLLCSKDYMLDNLLRSRSIDDLHKLLRAEASEYWTTHYTPQSSTPEKKKRIGPTQINLLGINFAVPMLFSYGQANGEEQVKEGAIEYLEKLGCEQNRIIDAWRRVGVKMENAFDSQAVLELHKEFCMKGLCWRCVLGKRIIKKTYSEETN